MTYDKKDICLQMLQYRVSEETNGKEIQEMRAGKENRKNSQSHFVLEGNALYEIDEECMRRKARERQKGNEKNGRPFHHHKNTF